MNEYTRRTHTIYVNEPTKLKLSLEKKNRKIQRTNTTADKTLILRGAQNNKKQRTDDQKVLKNSQNRKKKSAHSHDHLLELAKEVNEK